MAAGRIESGTIDAEGHIELGQAAGQMVSSWLVQLYDDASLSGTITPYGKATGLPASEYTAIAYKDLSTGFIATAGLTTNGLILVDSSGMDLKLNVAYTSGEIKYRAVPLVG